MVFDKQYVATAAKVNKLTIAGNYFDHAVNILTVTCRGAPKLTFMLGLDSKGR